MRAPGRTRLLYVGEGLVTSRILAHLGKAASSATAQGAIFSEAGAIEASWTLEEWLPHQRQELETDLIAAHVRATRSVPDAQFLG